MSGESVVVSGEIRRAKRTKKILTEFDLRNGEKLRIYVYFWGNQKYARDLGYAGNTIYKPVLVDPDGFKREIYEGRKGLPTLAELKSFYNDWNGKVASKMEAKRLKSVSKILYELAQISTFFNPRQAHVIYQILRIAVGGPTFKITKPSRARSLRIKIVPAIMISFRGYKVFKRITPIISGSRFSKSLKILRTYRDEVDRVQEELKQDLVRLAKQDGPVINLNTLADYANEQMIQVFEKEGSDI